MKKYIIGGGISGLIFKYYNPEFEIITPEIGGQFLQGTHSVSWIHDTPETRQLLTDLGLILDPYPVKIGYYFNGFVHNLCPSEYKKNIIEKKMTDVNTKQLPEGFVIPSTDLSVESNILRSLHIDFNTIFFMLQKDLKYIQDYVVSVDEDKITCKSGKVYEYDELISTAPAPIFWKLYDSKLDHLLQPKSKPEFKYLPITFVETWDKPLIYNDEFQMIYFFEEYTFTRLSKKEPSMYSYEFTGEIKNIKEYLPNCRITKINIQKIGRILPSKNEPPNANIKFLGRLSEWAFSSKIQDVIKTSIEYHNKVIINNQTHAK